MDDVTRTASAERIYDVVGFGGWGWIHAVSLRRVFVPRRAIPRDDRGTMSPSSEALGSAPSRVLPILTVSRGIDAGARIPIQRPTVVGRSGADFEVSDRQVSRRHCIVEPTESGPTVEDLGSTNGTFVNDRVVTAKTVLHHGDEIRIGQTVLEVAIADVSAGVGSVLPTDDGPTVTVTPTPDLLASGHVA